MNIPIGELVEESIPLKNIDIGQKLSALMEESFIGYLVLTVEGSSGIEEGLVLIKAGEAVGAIYEYVKFEKSLYGDTAMQHLLNAGLVEFGIVDVGTLTKQQIDLIIAFNEKIELGKHLTQKDLPKVLPKKYSVGFAEEALGEKLKKKESKFDVFKKLGLGKVS